jgi:hypothetical protein
MSWPRAPGARPRAGSGGGAGARRRPRRWHCRSRFDSPRRRPARERQRRSLQWPYRRVPHLPRPRTDGWIETTRNNTSDPGAFAAAGGRRAGRRRAASIARAPSATRSQAAAGDRSPVNTATIVRLLRPFVRRVVIANPLQVRAIAHPKIKTDDLDLENQQPSVCGFT